VTLIFSDEKARRFSWFKAHPPQLEEKMRIMRQNLDKIAGGGGTSPAALIKSAAPPASRMRAAR
jgi:hypothetical protein